MNEMFDILQDPLSMLTFTEQETMYGSKDVIITCSGIVDVTGVGVSCSESVTVAIKE